MLRVRPWFQTDNQLADPADSRSIVLAELSTESVDQPGSSISILAHVSDQRLPGRPLSPCIEEVGERSRPNSAPSGTTRSAPARTSSAPVPDVQRPSSTLCAAPSFAAPSKPARPGGRGKAASQRQRRVFNANLQHADEVLRERLSEVKTRLTLLEASLQRTYTFQNQAAEIESAVRAERRRGREREMGLVQEIAAMDAAVAEARAKLTATMYAIRPLGARAPQEPLGQHYRHDSASASLVLALASSPTSPRRPLATSLRPSSSRAALGASASPAASPSTSRVGWRAELLKEWEASFDGDGDLFAAFGGTIDGSDSATGSGSLRRSAPRRAGGQAQKEADIVTDTIEAGPLVREATIERKKALQVWQNELREHTSHLGRCFRGALSHADAGGGDSSTLASESFPGFRGAVPAVASNALPDSPREVASMAEKISGMVAAKSRGGEETLFGERCFDRARHEYEGLSMELADEESAAAALYDQLQRSREVNGQIAESIGVLGSVMVQLKRGRYDDIWVGPQKDIPAKVATGVRETGLPVAEGGTATSEILPKDKRGIAATKQVQELPPDRHALVLRDFRKGHAVELHRQLGERNNEVLDLRQRVAAHREPRARELNRLAAAAECKLRRCRLVAEKLAEASMLELHILESWASTVTSSNRGVVEALRHAAQQFQVQATLSMDQSRSDLPEGWFKGNRDGVADHDAEEEEDIREGQSWRGPGLLAPDEAEARQSPQRRGGDGVPPAESIGPVWPDLNVASDESVGEQLSTLLDEWRAAAQPQPSLGLVVSPSEDILLEDPPADGSPEAIASKVAAAMATSAVERDATSSVGVQSSGSAFARCVASGGTPADGAGGREGHSVDPAVAAYVGRVVLAALSRAEATERDLYPAWYAEYVDQLDLKSSPLARSLPDGSRLERVARELVELMGQPEAGDSRGGDTPGDIGYMEGQVASTLGSERRASAPGSERPPDDTEERPAPATPAQAESWEVIFQEASVSLAGGSTSFQRGVSASTSWQPISAQRPIPEKRASAAGSVDSEASLDLAGSLARPGVGHVLRTALANFGPRLAPEGPVAGVVEPPPDGARTLWSLTASLLALRELGRDLAGGALVAEPVAQAPSRPPSRVGPGTATPTRTPSRPPSASPRPPSAPPNVMGSGMSGATGASATATSSRPGSATATAQTPRPPSSGQPRSRPASSSAPSASAPASGRVTPTPAPESPSSVRATPTALTPTPLSARGSAPGSAVSGRASPTPSMPASARGPSRKF